MNIKLSESCLQSYPKQFEYYLEGPSPATCCAFNRHGTLLAIGCSDGKISILDFITRCFARILLGHGAAPVCALSWSRNSRMLLSATADNTIIKWCVETALPLSTYTMPCAIAGLCMHPRKESFAIVSFVRYAAIVLNVNEKNPRKQLPVQNDDDVAEHFSPLSSGNSMPYCTQIPVDRAELDEFITIATYDWKGHYIIAGTNKGRINILNADNLAVLASCRAVSTGSPTLTAIRQIEVAKKHPYFLINTSDRVIRLFNTLVLIERGRTAQLSDTNTQPVDAFCKLQDTVNRSTWRRCVFSGPDDEYVCGGSSRAHTLYIWELQSGAPVQQPLTLKGEALIDLQWHPHRAFICSVSTNGLVACWTEAHVESYGAYAPSFQELEENLELEEREGEFDIADEDDPTAANTSSSSNSRQSDENPSTSMQRDEQSSRSMQRLVSIDLDNDDFYRSSDEDECEPNTESALIFITLTPDIVDPVEDVRALKADQQPQKLHAVDDKRPFSSNSATNMPIKLLLGEDSDVDEISGKNSSELMQLDADDDEEPVNFLNIEPKKPENLPSSLIPKSSLPPRFEIFLPEIGQQQFSTEPAHPIMAFIKKEKPVTAHHHSSTGHSQQPSGGGKHGRKGSTSTAAASSHAAGGGKAEKGGGKHGINLMLTTVETTTVAIQQQQQQGGKRWRNGKGK